MARGMGGNGDSSLRAQESPTVNNTPIRKGITRYRSWISGLGVVDSRNYPSTHIHRECPGGSSLDATCFQMSGDRPSVPLDGLV